MQQRIAQFGDIVGRDRRCHADGDALRAIGEQVGETRRQDDRLGLVAGIIVAEIDGIFVDAFEQQARNSVIRFGVAIGRGAITVDIAEIALSIDERIARGEICARRTSAS